MISTNDNGLNNSQVLNPTRNWQNKTDPDTHIHTHNNNSNNVQNMKTFFMMPVHRDPQKQSRWGKWTNKRVGSRHYTLKNKGA